MGMAFFLLESRRAYAMKHSYLFIYLPIYLLVPISMNIVLALQKQYAMKLCRLYVTSGV